jgi:radical SAM protein with 4Fe4S-binding SPASM domain
MEAQKYEDWSLRVHQVSVANRIPINGAIEITQRCNNRCIHCYNNLPLKDQTVQQRELTCSEQCRILDEISAAGCLWLCFTGGEIFIRDDFLDIYTYAKQKGFIITLFTNGTLITPEIADYLVQWPPFSIEITLYGKTQNTYEQITGIPGSFDRCMQGIQLLTERQLALTLKTMAITLNKHEVWEMKRFVEQELGLEFRFDGMINPRCDCSQSPLEVRLTPAEVVEFDLQDPKRVAEWKKFATRLVGPSPSSEQAQRLWQCGSGLNTFAIDPNGMLRMCVLAQSDAFDLRWGSFQQGWDHFLYHLRQKTITKTTKCVYCELKDLCGMCPPNAELESLDEESPVDFLCQVAHLRAYAFGIEVAPHGDCEYCEGGSRYAEMIQKVKKLKKD